METIYVATHSGEFQVGVAYAGTVKETAEAAVAYYGGTVTVWEQGQQVRSYYTSTYTKAQGRGV